MKFAIAEMLGLQFIGSGDNDEYDFMLAGERLIQISYWQANSLKEAEELAADIVLTELGKIIAERR